jgi:hypothetical protein
VGAEKKKSKGPGTPVWSTAFLWALGQWAVCWFVTDVGLWETVSATGGAFASGWATAGLAGRLAKWGLGALPMMIAGTVLGLLVYSGAVTGLGMILTKSVEFDAEKLKAFLLSRNAAPPAVLGLITGLYVRARMPSKK